MALLRVLSLFNGTSLVELTLLCIRIQVKNGRSDLSVLCCAWTSSSSLMLYCHLLFYIVLVSHVRYIIA